MTSQMQINHDLPFRLNVEEDLSNWRSKTFWTKEPETVAWIGHHVGKIHNLHFVDVGANIGVYSLFALSLDQQVEVTSVEPSAINFQELQSNVGLNPEWMDRITCIQTPLSNASLDGFWDEVSTRVGDSGHQFGMEKKSNALPAQSTTGDSLLEKVDGDKQILLKIDVDGTEVQILEGFSSSFRRRAICSVLVELDQDQYPIACRFLSSHGYELDTSFDGVHGHSTLRRQQSGSSVRNYVFRPELS